MTINPHKIPVEKLRESERMAWEAMTASLTTGPYDASGITINVGTHGGKIQGSDISINEIALAKKNLERVQHDIENGVEADNINDLYESLARLWEIQFIQLQRQDRVEFMTVNNTTRLMPDMRDRIALTISNITFFFIAFLILFDDTYAFGQEYPTESLLLIGLFVFFAIFLRVLAYPRSLYGGK